MVDNQPSIPEKTERRLADLERRTRELGTLYRIASTTSQFLDLSALLERACTEVSQALAGEAACVLLLSDMLPGEVEVGAVQGLPDSVVAALQHVHWQQPVPDEESDMALKQPPLQQIGQALQTILRSVGFASSIILGLHAQGKPVGVLGVASSVQPQSTPNIPSVEWVWALGEQLGALIANARLYRETQRRVAELDALAQLSRAISSTLELGQVLQIAAQQVQNILKASVVAIRLIEDEQLVLRALVGVTHPNIIPPRVAIQGDYGNVIQQKVIWSIDDIGREAHQQSTLREMSQRENLESLLAVPMLVNDQALGILTVANNLPHRWLPGEIKFVQTIANQVALAVQNARLFRDTQRRMDELAGLARLSQAISSTFELEQILKMAMDQAQHILGISSGAFYLMEDGHLARSLVIGVPHLESFPTRVSVDDIFNLRLPAADSPLAKLSPDTSVEYEPIDSILSTTVRYVNDVESEVNIQEELRQLFLSENIRALLNTPLLVEGKLVGVLSVGYNQPHLWSREEIGLVQMIASHVALAVRNARLIQRVQADQHKLETILKQVADGVFTTDTHCNIESFNIRATALTGWRISEVWGKKCGEVLMPLDDNGRSICEVTGKCLCKQVLLEPTKVISWPARRWLRARNGQLIPVMSVTSPLLDGSGQVTGTVTAFWDLRHEEEVERLKNDFLSLVTHEMRTPISNIKLAVQNGLDKARGTYSIPPDELLQIVDQQCDRLLMLVERILQVSRYEAGSMKIEVRPTDLEKVVTRKIERWKRTYSDRAFEQVITQPLPRVEADETHLLTVLNILLDNAVKYSPPGTPIRILVRPARQYVQVTVANQGPAIPAAYQARLFEKFYRVPGTAGSGFGLGLYCARFLIEAQRGSIWLESKADSGTQVHFTLPMTEPKSLPEATHRLPRRKRSGVAA